MARNKNPEVTMRDVFDALDKQQKVIAARLLEESDRFKALSKDYAHQALFSTSSDRVSEK
jgi:hypothetical protein